MSVRVDGVSMPENCFRCFASQWTSDGQNAGYKCRALPKGHAMVSIVDARSKRREDCPIIETHTLQPHFITHKEEVMADMTYCTAKCSYTKCERHGSKIAELAKHGQKYVSIADFAPTCRTYIASVLEEVEKNERKKNTEKN